ncbi:MAG: hypothetical protein H7222_17095 [Methylotenera sp.]|nr:hypothetical protein [Oligoflexia bacterium]
MKIESGTVELKFSTNKVPFGAVRHHRQQPVPLGADADVILRLRIFKKDTEKSDHPTPWTSTR